VRSSSGSSAPQLGPDGRLTLGEPPAPGAIPVEGTPVPAAIDFAVQVIIANVGKVLMPLPLPVLKASPWPGHIQNAIQMLIGKAGTAPVRIWYHSSVHHQSP
jgi:hypothetical protein